MEPLTNSEPVTAAGPVARPVVVGVDGSARSRAALRWAVEQAVLRGTTLRVVHAVDVVENYASGRRIVEGAVQTARVLAPQLTVQCATPMRSVRAALLEEARNAELLVLARRARASQSRVTAHVASHAACPVVLVADPAATTP